MSGNTVRIGVSAVTANGLEALRRGWPVLMFVAGLIASALIHETGARRRFLSTSAITFGFEAGLLLSVQGLYLTEPKGLSHGTVYLIAAALLAFAMGLQNATVTHVGALSVKTTHVTGTLTQFAEGFTQFLFWTHDQIRANSPSEWRRVLVRGSHQESFREAGLMLLLWIAFIVGSICGVASRFATLRFLFVPPALVAILLAIIDLVVPIAASEEHRSSRPDPA